jgi:hypothetical protein
MSDTHSYSGVKPCPFCGVTPFIKDEPKNAVIECNNNECPVMCYTSEGSFDAAREHWNCRTSPPPESKPEGIVRVVRSFTPMGNGVNAPYVAVFFECDDWKNRDAFAARFDATGERSS